MINSHFDLERPSNKLKLEDTSNLQHSVNFDDVDVEISDELLSPCHFIADYQLIGSCNDIRVISFDNLNSTFEIEVVHSQPTVSVKRVRRTFPNQSSPMRKSSSNVVFNLFGTLLPEFPM